MVGCQKLHACFVVCCRRRRRGGENSESVSHFRVSGDKMFPVLASPRVMSVKNINVFHLACTFSYKTLEGGASETENLSLQYVLATKKGDVWMLLMKRVYKRCMIWIYKKGTTHVYLLV